jgi:translation initiation factor IF-3
VSIHKVEESIKQRGPKGKKRDEGYRINKNIYAKEIRLIDDAGDMRGVMTPREALQIAEEKGLDLIEIAPTAKPPTCKIMDYGKWKYENKKKQSASRKKQVIINTKEIQVRPRTDQHDLDTKLNRARKFLMEGDKVKINLRFQGREMAHQELGMELLLKLAKDLGNVSSIESPPKREGRQMFLLLNSDAPKIKEYKNLLKREAALENEDGTAVDPAEGSTEEATASKDFQATEDSTIEDSATEDSTTETAEEKQTVSPEA